jgi:hypothetical protein
LVDACGPLATPSPAGVAEEVRRLDVGLAQEQIVCGKQRLEKFNETMCS